ncbi:MAG: amine oxidase [Acidobacteria bacterium OLB17]|nr:MAG: amine oxidase [Acidobacteria bacterium OLB17]
MDYSSQYQFSFDVVNRCIAADLRRFDDANSRRLNVGIIGAGIAGLVAAYELRKLGHSVTIYETSAIPGGRIRTHRYPDGTYAELGAMRIPANHHSTLHYINELNLRLRPFVNFNSNAYYLIGGRRVRLADWEKIASTYRLRPTESDKDPRIILQNAMEESFSKLSTSEKYDIFTKLERGIALRYDAQTMRQALLDDNVISDAAFDFVGSTTSLHQYEHASFLEVLIDFFGLFRIDQYELVGGMDLLTSGLQSRSKGASSTVLELRLFVSLRTGCRSTSSRMTRKKMRSASTMSFVRHQRRPRPESNLYHRSQTELYPRSEEFTTPVPQKPSSMWIGASGRSKTTLREAAHSLMNSYSNAGIHQITLKLRTLAYTPVTRAMTMKSTGSLMREELGSRAIRPSPLLPLHSRDPTLGSVMLGEFHH